MLIIQKADETQKWMTEYKPKNPKLSAASTQQHDQEGHLFISGMQG